VASRPLRRFRFRGAPRTSEEGRTVLEALVGDRLPQLVRSVRYHRPRAPFCGVGYCTGCLVRVNGRPNVRACRREVEEGDRVASENSWPSPRFDVLGALDAVFPRGIDTLHGFRRPAFATRTYQRVVRRLAGYGRLPDSGTSPSEDRPPRRLQASVAIVGGGTAGAAAAARAAALGGRPLLLDRERSPGPIPGAEVLARTTATVLSPPPPGGRDPFTVLGHDDAGTGVLVRAASVIVATGSYDASLLFEGNDRPGVMTADLALALARAEGPLPFRRAVVVGSGPRALEVLAALDRRAAAVSAPGEIPPELVRRASELAVPLFPRSLVVRARGRSKVRAVELRRRGSGPTDLVPCDAIVLAHRRLPNHPLLFQAGAAMAWRAAARGYYPTVDAAGQTSVPALFAAGSVAGVDAAVAAASGEAAAEAALGGPRPGPPPAPPAPVPAGEYDGYFEELLTLPRRGKWVACPCEDVLLEELETAAGRGYRGIEVVKRYTGLGTGLCQGRYCVPDALAVLSVLERRAPSDVGYLTQRPPVVPTPLGSLAALHDEFREEVVP
jgi:sarcosine oxidase, subunit alpha